MKSRANDLTHAEIQNLIIRSNPIIIEIGAHDGTDSLEFLNRYPGIRLHSFECDPRAIKKWKDRISDPRAHLHEVAVSDVSGESTFYQSSGSPRPGVTDWDYSSSLCKPTGHLSHSPWCTFGNTIVVQTTTLDDWEKSHNFGYIDFIWMDVQGNENKVLSGGLKTLDKTRFVKLECHPVEMYSGQWTEKQFIEFLKGWECIGRYADDLLFKNTTLCK